LSEAVECLSSASYPGEPIALTWAGQRRQVAVILKRWRTPEGIGFRVQTSDDLVLDLMYDIAGTWHIDPSPGSQFTVAAGRNP
jgi:hypothetical protein